MNRIIAFYLPQFHTIPENDKWWGKGFTEWINTKKAKSLFNNHYQPREPLNDNYYNLLDIETLNRQTSLAKKYGISGFCFYHYWFTGKKLLEKPAEMLLENKTIDFPYCFSWANEPWTRAWDGSENEILIAQDYGNQYDWRSHFEYLLDFFKDKRYIKIDNKPVFVMYRTENFPLCDKMIELWDNLCKENGFDGIYFIETLNSFQEKSFCRNSEAVLEFEPMYTLAHKMPFSYHLWRRMKKILKLRFQPTFQSYDQVWKRILTRKSRRKKTTFHGAFVDWDNSARKGKNSTIFLGSTPNKFYEYLSTLLRKERGRTMFINAWNEWAEGAYLEPDKKYGFGYLEAIKKALEDTE